MYIGPDDGCQAVPDAIAPIDIVFFSLEPTRMPMSLPFITTSGPMFTSPMFMPDIWSGVGDAVAAGIGMFICSGDAFGDAAGIGMFICVCGDAAGVGEAAGICMPGMSFIFAGVGDGDGLGEARGVGEGIGIL